MNSDRYNELVSATTEENVRAQLIADTTRKIPLKHKQIESFFKGFQILCLDDILNKITIRLKELRKRYPEAVLCVNTGWLGDRDLNNRYKSEEFLILELIRRKQLELPLWNFENFHDLPKTCILLDDACYSGNQMQQKLVKLREKKDTEFHIILPYVSTICKDALVGIVAALKIKNVTFHFGDVMLTAKEVTGDDLEWLPKCEYEFKNRASKQSYGDSDYSSLILSTPDYKIADEKSTFTAYFAQLTNTQTLSEHYKQWKKKDFKTFEK